MFASSYGVVFITVGKLSSIMFKSVARPISTTLLLAAFMLPGPIVFEISNDPTQLAVPVSSAAIYGPFAFACVVCCILNILVFGKGFPSLTEKIEPISTFAVFLQTLGKPFANRKFIFYWVGFGSAFGAYMTFSWYMPTMAVLYMAKALPDIFVYDIRNLYKVYWISMTIGFTFILLLSIVAAKIGRFPIALLLASLSTLGLFLFFIGNIS